MRNQDAEEARIMALADAVQDDLDIGWWTIIHRFSTSTDDVDRVTAETKADWIYRQASILWNLTTTVALPDDEIRNTIVHEFIHILLDPLWNAIDPNDHEFLHDVHEFSVESIARALVSAYECPPRSLK